MPVPRRSGEASSPRRIAVIDPEDLELRRPQALVRISAGPRVINRASSITVRYPNGGPSVLPRCRVPRYYAREAGSRRALREGDPVADREEALLLRAGRSIAVLRQSLRPRESASSSRAANRRLDEELRRFSEKRLRYNTNNKIARVRRGSSPSAPSSPRRLKTPWRGPSRR